MVPALALALTVAAAEPEVVRESRPAAGTIVGVNIRTPDPARAKANAALAFAAIERWEAILSEWRPESAISELNAEGGPVELPVEAVQLLGVAERLRLASAGAFDIGWQGARLLFDTGGVRIDPPGKPIGLGAILKGFLAERAAEALLAAGETDFLVDAAGDIVARGDGGEGEDGWTVALPAFGRVVHLRDAALSSSGDDEQPGHIKDPRTGKPVTCSRAVAVVAPEGSLADGLSTAVFASCDEDLAEQMGAFAIRRDERGRVRMSGGAARVFRRR